MAYDEVLENRIQSSIDGWQGVSAKKMFGGVCPLIHGNMFCGIYQEVLIFRLGETAAADAVANPPTRPFNITGRPLRGFIMVNPMGLKKRRP